MEKEIIWQGDTLAVVRLFPVRVRRAIGLQLRRLQKGLDPTDWKPMKAIGPGLREIRIQIGGAYRLIYIATRPDGIHVLHAFRKKTQRTSAADINLAATRYKHLKR